MSNGFYVVPKLVEDVSIKRSIGEPSDDAWDGLASNPTVISLLKEIYDKLDNYSKVPIAVKITNKAGTPATYRGTYNGSSTLSTSSSQILMIYGDKGTYYDVLCMAPDQSWTPGSSYTGFRIYRANIGSGSFSNRFTLLDENDTPLLDLADSSYEGVVDTHLWIHKAMLVLDLPTN